MALRDRSRLDSIDASEVAQLRTEHLAEVEAFYRASYPGNWFDPRMLETGQYYGLRRNGTLASVAGIHVYSPSERVAAIGNVATDPALRGRGLARAVCARLVNELLKTVDHVGLNVKADNAAAIAAYERLGFEIIASYEECMMEGY
jgi:predicted GNAT family acetyltransferase